MNIHWLTIVGILLIGMGTLLTYLGQQIVNDKSSRQIEEKTKKIETLSEENIKLSEELTKLSAYNLNFVTGGDSFPFIDPTFNVATPERMDLWLVNGGLYPLYDITVILRDLTKFKQLVKERESRQDKTYINSNDFERRINVGNMRPAQITMDFFSIQTPDDGEIEYRIEIVSRNSYVEQMLSIKFSGRGKREFLKQDIKVNGKLVDQKNLYEKISRKN